MNDKTATLEELREMRKRGEIKPTLDDAPEAGTPEGFWDDAIPSKHLGGSQSILDAAIEIAIEDQARIAELKAELHTMKTAGIIEVAVRNPSVSEYMAHWEGRAEKAELRMAGFESALATARNKAIQQAANACCHPTNVDRGGESGMCRNRVLALKSTP
jgi:hypothetical protein